MEPRSARRRFEQVIAEERIPLDEAALLIAAEEDPDLVPEHYLARLDELAVLVRDEMRRAPQAPVHCLARILSVDEGFVGNIDSYYDPRNSDLAWVLRNRRGIPITLAIIYIEVGRRVGVQLRGIGFPAHFLVEHADEPRGFLDPFAPLPLKSPADCQAFLRTLTHGQVRMQAEHLNPTTRRDLLVRLLTNLKLIWRKERDRDREHRAIDRILLLRPDRVRDRLERARLNEQAELWAFAESDYSMALEAVECPERSAVEARLDAVQRQLAAFH